MTRQLDRRKPRSPTATGRSASFAPPTGSRASDCDEERCLYWRFVEAACDEEAGLGCAIQHFSMLDGGEVARWLLSVKERVEAEARRAASRPPRETEAEPLPAGDARRHRRPGRGRQRRRYRRRGRLGRESRQSRRNLAAIAGIQQQRRVEIPRRWRRSPTVPLAGIETATVGSGSRTRPSRRHELWPAGVRRRRRGPAGSQPEVGGLQRQDRAELVRPARGFGTCECRCSR